MTRLPPFLPLVAFDAVARHLSFTLASRELGLTQSAVSHRVKRLEGHFGVPLLRRLNPGVELTSTGAAVAGRLTELFDAMAGLERVAEAAGARPPLQIGASAAVSGWWLARRIAAVAAQDDGFPVALLPIENEEAARNRGLDLTLLWVPEAEARASSVQAPLFREHVFPVASPRLLPPGPLDPAGLALLPLIHKTERPRPGRGAAAGPEWLWPTWFAHLGLPARPAAGARDLHCGDIGTALSAAVAGAGVALGRSLLVRDAIADGRLRPVLDAAYAMPSSKIHVLRWSPALIGDPRRAALLSWLSATAAADAAPDRRPQPKMKS